jgi:rubredoxin
MSTEALDPKTLDRYECGGCGYIYEPAKGDNTSNTPAGVAFEALDESWRCPVLKKT